MNKNTNNFDQRSFNLGVRFGIDLSTRKVNEYIKDGGVKFKREPFEVIEDITED